MKHTRSLSTKGSRGIVAIGYAHTGDLRSIKSTVIIKGVAHQPQFGPGQWQTKNTAMQANRCIVTARASLRFKCCPGPRLRDLGPSTEESHPWSPRFSSGPPPLWPSSFFLSRASRRSSPWLATPGKRAWGKPTSDRHPHALKGIGCGPASIIPALGAALFAVTPRQILWPTPPSWRTPQPPGSAFRIRH